MELQTTQTGLAIIKTAENLLLTNCSAIGSNHKGACVSNIFDAIGATISHGPKNNPAYCAATAMLILKIAFPLTGRVSPFNDCRVCIGSDKFMAKAKKLGIRVDKKPAPGAVGFTRSSGANSGFHTVAVIWYIEGNGDIATIEGNSNGYHLTPDGCYVKVDNGIITKKRKPSTFYAFAHVEEYGDSGNLYSYIPMDNKIALSGLGKGEFCLTDVAAQEEIGNEDTIEDNIWYKIDKNRDVIAAGTMLAALSGLIYWSKK